MHIKIYTPGDKKEDFAGWFYLQESKNIKVELLNSKPFYYLFIKLNNHLAIFRWIRGKLTGKSTKYGKDPSLQFILRGFSAPFELLFSRNIVLSFAPYDNKIYYLLLLKLLGKNIVYDTSWNHWEEPSRYVVKPWPFTRMIWRIFLKDIRAIVPTKNARESLHLFTHNVVCVPHSIDVEIFTPVKKKKTKKIKVLYTGRLVKEKGLAYLFRLAHDLKGKPFEFIFVGEGYLKKSIEAHGKQLAIKVHDFISEKKELAKIYQQADIFILPSYAEGNWEEWFGITLVEAMASGVPVIATDCVGPKEIVEDGRNGFLVPQKNYGELKKVFLVLAGNRKLRKKMGIYGRKKALENYDVRKNSNKLYSLLFLTNAKEHGS